MNSHLIISFFLSLQYLSILFVSWEARKIENELRKMAHGTSSLGSGQQGSTVGYGYEEEEVSSSPNPPNETVSEGTRCGCFGSKTRKDKRKNA